MEKDKHKKIEKKVKLLTLVYALFIFVVVGLAMFGIIIYGLGVDNRLTQSAAGIFPYPAAVIDGVHIITVDNLKENTLAVKKFYEGQDFSSVGLKIDFTTEDGQKRLKIKEKEVLTKMIEDRVIEILANKRGITLTQEAVAQEIQKRESENGSQENLVNNLQKLYGWTVADFEAKIVKPDLYKKLLSENVRKTDPSNEQAKKKITQALADLQAKKSFAETAKNFSEGESAKNGGELGWFSADQMLPEISLAAFGLNSGERSDIIESSLGYHIIEVEDKKTEDGVAKVKVRQIFVRATNFADWLLGQEKTMGIYVPLKDIFWNKDAGRADFNNQDLLEFENNLDKNSPDDASVLFNN